MGTLFILPVYMQQVLHYSAVQTGIYLIPYSFSILIISFVTGPISQKYNNKYLLLFGIIIAAIGVFVIQNLFSGPEIVTGSNLAIGLLIYGVGMGFVLALLGNMFISAVPDDIATGVMTSDVLDVDMPKDEVVAELQDYAHKMQTEHTTIDLSKYPEEKVNELKSIVNTAIQAAMKQSFLVIFIVLF